MLSDNRSRELLLDFRLNNQRKPLLRSLILYKNGRLLAPNRYALVDIGTLVSFCDKQSKIAKLA